MSWQDKALAAFWADAFANEPLDSHRRIEAAIAAAAASLLPSTDAPMTNHPITPPPELVRHWIECCDSETLEVMIEEAARWGADQELEACCEWLQDPDLNVDTYKLRAARRQKPPSLKDEALKALRSIERGLGRPEDTETIRRALEQLND